MSLSWVVRGYYYHVDKKISYDCLEDTSIHVCEIPIMKEVHMEDEYEEGRFLSLCEFPFKVLHLKADNLPKMVLNLLQRLLMDHLDVWYYSSYFQIWDLLEDPCLNGGHNGHIIWYVVQQSCLIHDVVILVEVGMDDLIVNVLLLNTQ